MGSIPGYLTGRCHLGHSWGVSKGICAYLGGRICGYLEVSGVWEMYKGCLVSI